MKFTIFQSDKGDCLLLETDDGKRILVDGGMPNSYPEHVAPALGKLREAGVELDLVYLSHIDQDHIGGVLRLMDNEAAWRVFDHQSSIGNTHAKKPKVPRPPVVQEIWHNPFHEQVGDNAGDIADMLATSAQLLAAAASPKLQELAEEHQDLALSQLEAMRLKRRVGDGQLNIPVNRPFGGKLMYVRSTIAPFALGNLRIFIIGPFKEDLKILRDDWNAYLIANRNAVRKVQEQADRDEDNMGNDVTRLLRRLEITATVFGDRNEVTPPNLASLMLYVEEPSAAGADRRYLLTGDGAYQDILKGLKKHNKLDAATGGLHVDVLKGQHHGSENNWHEDFCRAITADHYVFCGNGEHKNPDLGVIKMLLDSRVGPATKRGSNPQTGNPFTLWFSCRSTVPNNPATQTHMRRIEEIVAAAAAAHPGKIRFHFLEASAFAFMV